MAEEEAPNEEAPTKPARKSKPFVRPWVRAIHRDFGYFVVGLTVIYAVSGLAVNHVADYTDGDANFVKFERTVELGPLAGDDDAIARTVREKLAIEQAPKEVFRQGEDEVQISFDRPTRTVTVNPKTGHVHEEGQRPRFFVRLANWLHLNRGKKSWTYIADTYAVILLFLAISGLFMIPGRKGLIGRGLVIAIAGAAIPALYVHFSGGP
ncbi:MAG: hypothetical protein HOO96_21350 [Polyangiaceae bacterium]|nr:hypothetical protein [Polyangiaceae bacterium]